MARRKKMYGGGGGGGSRKTLISGIIGQVLGGALMLFALILFGIGVAQLDTAYTAASGDQVGLRDIMGIFGMVLFLVFIGAGVVVLGGTAVYAYLKSKGGSWMDAFIGFAFATVGLVIALILNTILQGQLNTTQVAINALTNIANFPGLYAISRIFGIIIFLSLLSPGIAAIAGAAQGAVGRVRAGM